MTNSVRMTNSDRMTEAKARPALCGPIAYLNSSSETLLPPFCLSSVSSFHLFWHPAHRPHPCCAAFAFATAPAAPFFHPPTSHHITPAWRVARGRKVLNDTPTPGSSTGQGVCTGTAACASAGMGAGEGGVAGAAAGPSWRGAKGFRTPWARGASGSGGPERGHGLGHVGGRVGRGRGRLKLGAVPAATKVAAGGVERGPAATTAAAGGVERGRGRRQQQQRPHAVCVQPVQR